jgi:predicted DCC family thiol-disulfide oxidoreductase YuxK
MSTAMERATVFYDGGCGLCHRAVLFALRRDRDGSRFRFAPLDGETFEREIPAESRAAVPDSLVLSAPDEEGLLVRSAAVVAILRRLGGGWRLLGSTLALIPRPLRDTAYDLVARWRHRLFGQPARSCPMVPEAWRDRFAP